MSNTNKKASGDKTIQTVKMCVLLIIGILFCLSILIGERNLSLIFGIGFIVAGVALVAVSLIKEKDLLSTNSIIGYLAIALGIISISEPIIGVILLVVPYILIVLGCGIFADSFLAKFVRKGKMSEFLLKLIFGIIAIVLGVLLLVVAELTKYTAVVFGAALVVYALYSIITLVAEANKSKSKK